MSLALLAALAMQPAPDPRGDAWLEIDRSETLVMSLNESAVRRDGDNVYVQLRMEQPGQPRGEKLAVIEARLDCRARTRTALAIHSYEDDGRPRATDRDLGRLGPVRAGSGTNLGDLIDAVCHRTGWGEEGAAE